MLSLVHRGRHELGPFGTGRKYLSLRCRYIDIDVMLVSLRPVPRGRLCYSELTPTYSVHNLVQCTHGELWSMIKVPR